MDAYIMKNLAFVVKNKRKALGFSQKDLADRLGKPQPSVARVESGKASDIHINFVFQLAESLETKPEIFLSEIFEGKSRSFEIKKELFQKNEKVVKRVIKILSECLLSSHSVN